jgi:hypothetical protein
MALNGRRGIVRCGVPPTLPQGDLKGPIPTQHRSRPYKDYEVNGNYLLYVHDYYLLFLVKIK